MNLISKPDTRDVFLLGQINAIESILKSIKKTGETANDIDFEEVLEHLRRNLSNPDFEEFVVDADTLEDLR